MTVRLKAETDVVLMEEIKKMDMKSDKLVLEREEEDEDGEEQIFILRS